MKRYFILFFVLSFFHVSFAQEENKEEKMERMQVNGEWMYALITEGDTLYVADLDGTSITMPRTFANNDEKRRYYKLKRSAQKVYPYALKAITLYKEAKDTTSDMRRRKRKKYTKKMQKELKEEFEKPLKKLTKTQGKVLIAMIERELDTSFYKVVKELRNGMIASYWNVMGKMFGYKIKKQYDPTDDPIMEAVLSDFDIDLDN
jgi:hypothetical protein